MLDSEALRQVGKLSTDCDRRWLQYAVTDEYLDALARAAAAAVKGTAARKDRVMVGGESGGVLPVAEPMQGWSGGRRLSASSDKSL